MPAILSFLLPLLIKYALPLILKELATSGAAGEAEALAVKVGMKVVTSAEGIKTFHAPTDFPNSPPQYNSQNNISEK